MKVLRHSYIAGAALAILLGASSAHSQQSTAPGFTAGTSGAACDSTQYAYGWPDSNGYTLKCVSNVWTTIAQPASAAGLTGYVQFNNGGALAGSANLFWNNTNGYLGIGTATPANRLQVPWLSGDSVTTAVFGSSSSSDNQDAIDAYTYSGGNAISASNTSGYNAIWGYSTGSATGIFGQSNTGTAIWGQSASGTSGEFQSNSMFNSSTTLITKAQTSQTGDLFQAQNSSGTALFKIQVSGNVGIGSTSPQAQLDVEAGTATTDIYGNTAVAAGVGVYGNSSGTGVTYGVKGSASSSAGYGGYFANTGTGFGLGVATGGIYIGSSTPGTVTNALYNSSGVLYWNGTALATAGGGVTSVSNSDGTLTISPTTGAVVASLNLGHADTWTAAQTIAAAGAASTPAFDLTGAPYTAGTATTNYPLIYADTTGSTNPTTWSTSGTYFGINSASGYTGNFLDFRVNGGNSVFNVSNTGAITFNTFGYLYGSGLQVYTGGAAMIGNGAASSGTGTIYYGAQNANSFASIQSTTAVGTTDYINFLVGNNGATEAMRIIHNGNVGIGTTAPAYRLDVPWLSGDTAATANFGSGNSSNNLDAVDATSYSRNGVYGVSTSGTGVSGQSSSGYGVMGRSGTNASGYFTTLILSSTAPTLVTQAGWTQTGDLFQAQNSSGTALFKIQVSGNVGIGTTSPGYALDVYSSGNPLDAVATQTSAGNIGVIQALAPNMTAGGTAFITVGTTSSANNWASLGFTYAGNSSASNRLDVEFYGTSPLMSILAGGNVGIGTSSPSYTLHVNGSVAGTSAYNNLSDARLKTDISDITNGLGSVQKLKPIHFHWQKPEKRTVGKGMNLPVNEPQIGFLAQDVEKVIPEAVVKDANGLYSMEETKLIPVLVQAVKELETKNENMSGQISVLTSEIAGLKKDIAASKHAR
jgi:hypothetical protein